VKVLSAIVVAICLIASGAPRGHTSPDGPGRRDTHAALRGVSSTAHVLAPGRAHTGPDGALPPAIPAAPPPSLPPRLAAHATSRAPARTCIGLVDATSHRSRAPPPGSDPES
jgi:hypothetical protein